MPSLVIRRISCLGDISLRRCFAGKFTCGFSQFFSSFREDSFIRVCGYIRREDDLKRHVVAFGIYQVTDFNEITYHMFNAIYASLSLQKVCTTNVETY